MARAFSSNSMRALMAQQTSEVFLLLLTFTHVPTSETYRCVLNTENITSRGHVYTATYFDILLPEDSDKPTNGCQLTMQNVDMALITLLRAITQPLQCTLEIVLASSPDTVELSLTDLVLREASWDADTVSGRLANEDVLNQGYPADLYEPATFPGLF